MTVNVKFQSPVEWSAAAFEAQSAEYVVPPECVPAEYQGECHANHIRKMQASFSWDWGPAFPSMGIWWVSKFAIMRSLHDIVKKRYVLCIVRKVQQI